MNGRDRSLPAETVHYRNRYPTYTLKLLEKYTEALQIAPLQSKELSTMTYDSTRPWGFFENLDEQKNHKVKRITVKPGKRLSLQRHKRRAEHWFVLSGEAVVRIGSEDHVLKSGESVDIPREAIHRVGNNGTEDLVLIEIQTGDYFGEDDIERLEDDFARV